MLADFGNQSVLLQAFLLNKASPYQSLNLFLFDTRFLSLSFILCKGRKKGKNGLYGSIPVCDLWTPRFSWSISNLKRKSYVHFTKPDQVIFIQSMFTISLFFFFFTKAWKCFHFYPMWILTKRHPTLLCTEWQDVIYVDSFLSRGSGSLHSGLCESQLEPPGRAGSGDLLSGRCRFSASHALHS